jgi:nitroimidazol reductase NimA-like FMN-containing flavoprotein (pyridoxamine 5'-phosphate oxidase superfamily)
MSNKQRHEVRRLPERATYDRDTVNAIIDEALICHVGIADGGQPFVLPTIHARDGDTLLFHGLKGGRLLRAIASGAEICVAITLLDGLVLARSAFHHSMGYRSVVLFGRGRVIEDEAGKLAALERLTEHVVPGRWADARPPNAKELKMTTVVAMPIDAASAKQRDLLPKDDAADYALPIWAGYVPLPQTPGTAVTDPEQQVAVEMPDYVANYRRP